MLSLILFINLLVVQLFFRNNVMIRIPVTKDKNENWDNKTYDINWTLHFTKGDLLPQKFDNKRGEERDELD